MIALDGIEFLRDGIRAADPGRKRRRVSLLVLCMPPTKTVSGGMARPRCVKRSRMRGVIEDLRRWPVHLAHRAHRRRRRNRGPTRAGY